MSSIMKQPEIIFFMMLSLLFFGSVVAKIFRIPTIIALILGGLLIGPKVLNILPLNDTVESFATIGLIYLMFNIGIEIDLSQFKYYKKRATIFFLMTYLLPQVSGIAVGWLFGLSLTSSILLGAIYASYTLVAYPIASELGILKNEAVALSVCASVFTDMTALFILTFVLDTKTGGSIWLNFGSLIGVIIICTTAILLILPLLAKVFFRFYSDGKINFPFVLLVLFASASLAQVTGLHAVIGSFLGGIAINQLLPKESRVVRQVLFTGETIFVPLFLISIGMRIDVKAIFTSWETILLGLSITFAVYITKFAAAWGARRLFNYSKPEMYTMWGLTHAQAAATLAIVLIGTRAHLFSDTVLQASIIMVLFTLISSPLMVKYFGSKLSKTKNEHQHLPIMQNILIPITKDEFPNNTIEFASRIARFGKGKLLFLNIANTSSAMGTRRELLRAGPMKDPDTKIELINRIEKTSITESILNKSIENEASLILLNWDNNQCSKDRIFNQDLDEIIWNAPSPVAVVLLKKPIKSIRRVVAVIGENIIGIKLQEQFPEIAKDIAKALDVPIHLLATKHYIDKYQKRFKNKFQSTASEIIPITDDIISTVMDEVSKNDLVLIPSMGSKDRFDKNPDLIPYNLWQEDDISLIMIHFN